MDEQEDKLGLGQIGKAKPGSLIDITVICKSVGPLESVLESGRLYDKKVLMVADMDGSEVVLKIILP